MLRQKTPKSFVASIFHIRCASKVPIVGANPRYEEATSGCWWKSQPLEHRLTTLIPAYRARSLIGSN